MSPSRRSRRRRSKADLSAVNANTELALVDGLAPEERRASISGRYSPTLLLVAVFASIGVLAYAGFLLNPSFRGDLIPWLIVISCELILIFQASMALWTMLSGYGRQPNYRFQTAQAKLYDPQLNAQLGVEDDPTKWPMHIKGRQIDVDVLITVYGESLDVIETTARAAMAMHGRHTTWILDDGDSDEVRDLAKFLGCRYVRRLGSSGAKAGNVNNALSVAKAEFFVIFDADFVAKPEFLYEMIPFMEDPNVAFVQAPQVYGNLNNIVSRGAGFIQMVFYRFIQPGRNEFNAAFCVGTNVLFRRAAVKDVGGIYTQSKSEDIWTSILMHERGWRSIFQPKELAVGETPDTIEAYSKQQLRWATGGFEILFTHNPLSPRRRLHMDQRLMYFVTCTFYFTGIAPGLLMMVPLMEVFFDLRPVTLAVKWYEWALFYPGFYVMQIVLAAVIAGTFRWEVLLLAANSFPIYIKAFFNALLKVDTKWAATGATKGRTSAFNFIMVQVWAFVLMVGTSIVSIYRDYSMGHLNVATFWCVLNAVFLGAFVVTAFLENHQKKQERKLPRHCLEERRSLDPERQLVPAGGQPETLDVEAILDAQAARDALAERPETYNRKS
ncbi:glycosyltransferase family 2 protein [Arachnia propionica]|uniref:glycosyltransferase family 2 protein n=1 Tax=Arachnia propionica TaxID=1750 RepID=UPI003C6F3925